MILISVFGRRAIGINFFVKANESLHLKSFKEVKEIGACCKNVFWAV